ncbi:SLAIN motif-containing protein-like [Epinephelus fuscoguttatus]|uniref:SLAIN motif-containing protein-like n=1 Tax=Epinephelus fuscoguttatus TaxID=293821 RepID=UPI0020D1F242|nr:SLAIN motif-containing protein-like [Epinephelus fuscoguttatus]
MELQNQLQGDWSRYFCNRPVEFDENANHHLLCSKLESSSVRLEGNSDPYCSIWGDDEQARVKSCNNRSFAMDARIRLDHLKSACNSPLPRRATDGILYNFNCPKDNWDSDGSQEEESALDSVELLDVEDDVQDEESCVPHRLYESPKKQAFVERSESALRWCRHVLDNPSPEMEAACRSLMNRLDQRSSSHFYRRPAVFHRSVSSSMNKTSVSTTHNNVSDGSGDELSLPHDSITPSYKLQDMTDVHIMARIQEASLRQDYVSTPAGRSPESQSGLSSLSSSPHRSPSSVARQGCQSPTLARLHQQVAQLKLLKRAQNQATSPGRTRSPLRTSLRSLQAVRNSRSLDIDDDNNYQSAEQIPAYPPSAHTNSNSSLHSVRNSSDRTAAVKRLLRSQSLSPCRIPHPAKGYLSLHGRVFASPERSTTVAWGRNVSSTQR